jgi:hypothetical protein
VQPILSSRCVQCHPNAGEPSLKTYSDTMKFVVAGNPSSSKIVSKTSNGTMKPYLTTAQAATIKQWVTDGAKP